MNFVYFNFQILRIIKQSNHDSKKSSVNVYILEK